MEDMNKIKIIDLKSPILNIIFSFINQKKKLNIIINNKKLQKKLEINIKNYEKISERYKIGERNGKGKEYYIGKLIFEGEYLNGERKGKGKEYLKYNDNSNLIEPFLGFVIYIIRIYIQLFSIFSL